MSRSTTYICNRCGSPVLENRSILEIKAGELAKRCDGEPWIDLCGSCADRFEDFLRSGKEPTDHNPSMKTVTRAVPA